MGRNKTAQDYLHVLRLMQQAGISGKPSPNRPAAAATLDHLPSLQARVQRLLGIVNNPKRNPGNMLFFVMYDIESNKVRYNVVKYLQRMGCTRIQKSIFLADLPAAKYHAIRDDLATVQSLYDNSDSIVICPISTDLLQSMKVIGQSIDIDVITHSRNTLFF